MSIAIVPLLNTFIITVTCSPTTPIAGATMLEIIEPPGTVVAVCVTVGVTVLVAVLTGVLVADCTAVLVDVGSRVFVLVDVGKAVLVDVGGIAVLVDVGSGVLVLVGTVVYVGVGDGSTHPYISTLSTHRSTAPAVSDLKCSSLAPASTVLIGTIVPHPACVNDAKGIVTSVHTPAGGVNVYE